MHGCIVSRSSIFIAVGNQSGKGGLEDPFVGLLKANVDSFNETDGISYVPPPLA